MKSRLTILAIAALAVSLRLHSASDSPEWTEVARADLTLMGDYEGQWVEPKKGSYQAINPHLMAQVMNLDTGRYRVRFAQDLDRRADPYFDGEGSLEGETIRVESDGWTVEVSASGIKGVGTTWQGEFRFALQRVVRSSPTIGAPPPKGASVLFDGSNLGEWMHGDGRAASWKLVGDGAMEIDPSAANPDAEPKIGGDLLTKRTFEDVRYHMEFRYPVEPGKRGQGRGNSGLFFQGYEVQVLNSYGLEAYWNQCGALYKLVPAKVDATRPPMQWQTYDVVYRAPRFVGGKLSENARITVRLNGVSIHNDQEIWHGTSHRQSDRDAPAPSEPAPIRLQDHSNRIQYRNIWVEEL